MHELILLLELMLGESVVCPSGPSLRAASPMNCNCVDGYWVDYKSIPS